MIAASVFDGPRYALAPDLILMPDGEIEGCVIVIEGSTIAAIARRTAVVDRWPDLHITELPGHAIVPGVVDAHHHVIEPFAKGLTFGEPAQMWKRIWMPLEANATVESCYEAAKWTFLEALRGGITTIVEHAVRGHDLADGVHRAAEETGIRLVSPVGGYDLKNFSASGPTPDASASVDAVIELAEQHIEDCKQYARITPSVACGTVQSNSAAMIAAMSAFCADRGIVFQIHANEHTLEVHASIEATGKRPIEFLYDIGALRSTTLLAHATLVTPNEIDMIAETDAAISYNPVAAIWKGNAISPALTYIDRGIRIGLGSDATRNDAFRMIEAAETCQRIAFGIPTDDFSCGAGWVWFDAATRGGADVAGLGATTGRLAEGYEADFLILDCRGPEVLPRWDFPWELVRYFDRADIAATVVGGRPAVIAGKAVGFDSEKFVADSLAAGVKHVESSHITRLHGTSAGYRPRR
jgi:cytosine/adenosine deaminase-related metal-dependent hydrolase